MSRIAPPLLKLKPKLPKPSKLYPPRLWEVEKSCCKNIISFNCFPDGSPLNVLIRLLLTDDTQVSLISVLYHSYNNSGSTKQDKLILQFVPCEASDTDPKPLFGDKTKVEGQIKITLKVRL